MVGANHRLRKIGIHEVQCMPYKNFPRYFLAINFYAVAFHMIILLIAFHASYVALLMLSLFFSHSIMFSYHLSTQVTLRCITCHPYGMLMMTTGVRHTNGGGATSKLRWRHLQLQVAPLLSSSGATS